MKKRELLFIILLAGLLLSGCVKESYNMDKLAGDVSLKPTFGLPAFSGEVTLEDVVEGNDTIVFDSDKFVRFVFSKDSAFNVEVSDLIGMDTLFSYDVSERIGALRMSPFSEEISYSLANIVLGMDFATRNYIMMHDRSICDFPSFSGVTMETRSLVLPNFEYATFADGTIDVTLSNTLPVVLDGVAITLYDSYWGTAIGSINFPAINPNTTNTASLDLSGLTIHNTLVVLVNLTGSGGATGVYVDLTNQGIDFSIEGKDLMIESGRFVVPSQNIPDLILQDTLSFSDEEGVEVEEVVITTGSLQFNVSTDLALSSTVNFTLPTALQNGVPFTGIVTMELGEASEQDMSIDNTIIDLTSVTDQPYNLLPYEYDVEVNSAGQIIDFDSNDMIRVRYALTNNNIDYIRGYFGEREEEIPADTIDLDMDGLFNKLSGSIYLANPRITLDYANSIGVPFILDIDAKGIKDGEETALNYSPFEVDYPTGTDTREVTGSMIIDNTNSAIADLISSIPENLIFGGSVRMYPEGYSGERNSYLFGDSKIEGELTFELPLEFRINNLQFTDTLDNFFNSKEDQGEGFYQDNNDEEEDDSSVADMLDKVSLRLEVDNGFPFSLSASVVLYDTLTSTNLYTLDLSDLIDPAPVDANGKVTSAQTSVSTVELNEQFFDQAKEAQKIIIQFSLNTTGTDNVKIYSDYTIGFKANLLVDADLVLTGSDDN